MTNKLLSIQFQAHAPYPYGEPIFAGPFVAYGPQDVVSVISSTSFYKCHCCLDVFLYACFWQIKNFVASFIEGIFGSILTLLYNT